MQATIHLEDKAGCLSRPCAVLRSKCIVGCIFNCTRAKEGILDDF
jgi:hypothetical protein